MIGSWRLQMGLLALLALSLSTRAEGQTPPTSGAPAPAPSLPAARAACASNDLPDEGCRGEASQHSYRFPLLKRWSTSDVTVPIYAVDNHPEIPNRHKLLRYCAPAVDPQYLYATPHDRW
jgi:hypothetical protein